VTPSAVSHQIQLLEDFLGVPLFQRRGGKATLTHAGHLYAQEVRNAFGVISNATSLVAPKSQSGHLVIACSPSFATKWLQPRIPDFLSDHPGVKVRLFTLSSHETFDRDSCDVVILYRNSIGSRRRREVTVNPCSWRRCNPFAVPVCPLRSRCARRMICRGRLSFTPSMRYRGPSIFVGLAARPFSPTTSFGSIRRAWRSMRRSVVSASSWRASCLPSRNFEMVGLWRPSRAVSSASRQVHTSCFGQPDLETAFR
jgi:DNA-binding transcriptional LysR family regulator